MPSEPHERGSGRRQFVRDIVGKPGSFRRWILGTAVWLFACFMFSFYMSWIGRIFLFMVAIAIPLAAYGARRMLVGDEDELRADLRKKRSGAGYPPIDKSVEPEADEAWLGQTGDLVNVPKPPIMDDDGQV